MSGTVSLGDFGGGPVYADTVLMDVEVVGTDSHGVRSGITMLDSNGDFKYLVEPAVPAGSYDVYVKPTHWLRKYVGRVTFNSVGASGVTATCVNGDCDGDNSVSIGDFGAVSAAWATVPSDCDWDEMADLDGSLEVDIGDVAILSANFGLDGDSAASRYTLGYLNRVSAVVRSFSRGIA